jgi:outer membrane protein assembly factor BamB
MDGERGLRWHASLPRCGGITEVVIARDSTAYVRTSFGLHAFTVEGSERWRMSVGGSPVPRNIFTPTVTPDSLVVVASSPRVVIAFRPDGQESFRFTLPDNESLVTAPLGNNTEGVLLLSSQALYALGADGTLRWRKANGEASPPG